MCELFGASSREAVEVNGLLQEFYSHGKDHPHGWGLAVLSENAVSIEKEPLPSHQSAYLKECLDRTPPARVMIAHIRKASVGSLQYENCHPFVQRDNSGRVWTMAHNGTIFSGALLEPYKPIQEGGTDSERILCHIIARINAAQTAAGRALDAGERFALLDRLVCELAPRNKINLLIYDSELFYVHTNYRNTLHVRQTDGTALFSTVPLEPTGWEPLVFTTLCAYQDGCERFRGTCHGSEYFDNPAVTEYPGIG